MTTGEFVGQGMESEVGLKGTILQFPETRVNRR